MIFFVESTANTVGHWWSNLMRFSPFRTTKLRFDPTHYVFIVRWNHSNSLILSLNSAPSWSYSKLLLIKWSIIIPPITSWSWSWSWVFVVIFVNWTFRIGKFFLLVFLDGIVDGDCTLVVHIDRNGGLGFLLDQVLVDAVEAKFLL